MACWVQRLMWLIVSEIIMESRDMLAHYADQCFLQICESWDLCGFKKRKKRKFTARGSQRYPSAQRCEVRGGLNSAAIKNEWISLPTTEARGRCGNITVCFCIRIMPCCLAVCSRCVQEIAAPGVDGWIQSNAADWGWNWNLDFKCDFLWDSYPRPSGEFMYKID